VVQRPGAEFLPPDDKGRLVVTRTPGDAYSFKVPSLRNVASTAPCFHSGSSWDLEQAVAVMGTVQLGVELSPAETKKVAAFLVSLTGRQPSIVLPVLPPSVPSTPRPKS
jgi:cytochrome c peroxidase